MLSVPGFGPAAAGVKVTEISQLASTARDEDMQLPAAEYGPVASMALILISMSLIVLLVTVSDRLALLPTATSPKSREVGARVRGKRSTVTGILSCTSGPSGVL